MTATHLVLYIWAYLLGLLVSAFELAMFRLPIGAIALLGSGCVAAIALPRFWRAGLNSRGWLVWGLIGCLAVFYCHWRSPKPSSTDVSALLTQAPVPVVVEGQVETAPRLTRSQNQQFWVRVVRAERRADAASAVATEVLPAQSGRLYVTARFDQQSANASLEPGQGVRLTGILYEPKPATNPGSFNFQTYLQRQGCFAGLRADGVTKLDDWMPGGWLELQGRISHRLWQMRQRISTTFIHKLGDRRGLLVSGMVLGRKAVDLPPDLADEFTQAGLAHTLAASGFHVSLLLGMVLWFTRSLMPSQQAWIGGGILIGYIGLTGLQPSILRASLMGVGALVGKVYEQKMRPVGVLLAVAVILLLVNPLWIFNLGFQLSFLATLGLLVTAPPLTKMLDWLPPTIAAAIAIPMAAYLWTLPIQLFALGTVSSYSIFVNIVLTPLVVVLSLGGMLGAAIALVSPELGGWVVWPLQLLADWLIKAVETANGLPGSVYAVGRLSIVQVIVLYGLFGWVWWRPKGQILPWIAGGMAIAVIFLPARMTAATQSTVTFLNTVEHPVVVVQHHGTVGLIHSGSETDIRYTVLPFLQQQGINRIDWAIAPHSDNETAAEWSTLASHIPISTLWLSVLAAPDGVQNVAAIEPQRPISAGALNVTVLSQVPKVSYFALGDRFSPDRTWVMIESWNAEESRKLASLALPKAQVLHWVGYEVPADVLRAVEPETVIVKDERSLTSDRTQQIHSSFASRTDGAIAWHRDDSIAPLADLGDLQ